MRAHAVRRDVARCVWFENGIKCVGYFRTQLLEQVDANGPAHTPHGPAAAKGPPHLAALWEALERKNIHDVALEWNFEGNPRAPIRIEWKRISADANGGVVLHAIEHCQGMPGQIFLELERKGVTVDWPD
jgi:hypothetical protein